MIETILTEAANELEELRQAEQSIIDDNNSSQHSLSSSIHLNTRFPSNCLKLLYGIPGNLRCVDCDATNPQWATLSFGALICIDCSGRHRQMGVQVSVVRSITMDSFKHSDILAMLEGGNKQLGDFFDRHGLSQTSTSSPSSVGISSTSSSSSPPQNKSANDVTSIDNRYKTNAAKFYKKNLTDHVMKVIDSGVYKGRDTFRSPKKKKRRCGQEQGIQREAKQEQRQEQLSE